MTAPLSEQQIHAIVDRRVQASIQAFARREPGLHESRDHADNTLLPRKIATPGPTAGAGYVLETGSDGVASWQPYAPFVGMLAPNPLPSTPARWVKADGSSVLRASYLDLFTALNLNKGAVTVTLAAPGVFTLTAHGLVIGDSVFLTTDGALPTGMAANTRYYVMTVPTANTFTLGTTRSVNVATGAITVATAVNTSVSQSGTHTLFHSPWGVADATHFTLPDGRDAHFMGRAAGGVLGLSWGEATHLLTGPESGTSVHTHPITGAASATHTHTLGPLNSVLVTVAATIGVWRNDGALTTSGPSAAATNSGNSVAADASSAHNNIPPHQRVDWIIYAGV